MSTHTSERASERARVGGRWTSEYVPLLTTLSIQPTHLLAMQHTATHCNTLQRRTVCTSPISTIYTTSTLARSRSHTPTLTVRICGDIDSALRCAIEGARVTIRCNTFQIRIVEICTQFKEGEGGGSNRWVSDSITFPLPHFSLAPCPPLVGKIDHTENLSVAK